MFSLGLQKGGVELGILAPGCLLQGRGATATTPVACRASHVQEDERASVEEVQFIPVTSEGRPARICETANPIEPSSGPLQETSVGARDLEESTSFIPACAAQTSTTQTVGNLGGAGHSRLRRQN